MGLVEKDHDDPQIEASIGERDYGDVLRNIIAGDIWTSSLGLVKGYLSKKKSRVSTREKREFKDWKQEMQFSSYAHILQRENRLRLCCAAALIGLILMVATPRIPHSPTHHFFADMRNFLGVPNTLNVLTAYPFLLIGVPGLVFCLSGNCFGISLKGETWGWVLFYAGIAAAAFGSAYYHLKPDDGRIIWDKLPMMISTASLLSNLTIERVNERVGISCLVSLLVLVFVSAAFERTFDDLRLCMIFHFIPCIAIPILVFLFPPKYTHSSYWFWATGFYLLSRFESLADMKVYSVDRYIISGHSLEHLCLSMVSLILTVMLWLRSIKISRDY